MVGDELRCRPQQSWRAQKRVEGGITTNPLRKLCETRELRSAGTAVQQSIDIKQREEVELLQRLG